MASIPLASPSAVNPAGTPTRTPVLFGLRITFGGMLCFAIVMLVGLAGLNSEANLLYLLTGISLGVLLVSLLAPMVIVRGVDVDRILPEAVVAGQPFRITYVVRNRRRFANVWAVIVSERPDPLAASRKAHVAGRFPDAFADVLAPGEEKRFEVMGVCPARGRLVFPGVRVLSRFPFGLFSCHSDLLSSAEVLVYPSLGRFRHDPWRDYRAATSMSNREMRNRSGHEEFYGVREYRQGDNLRWIHWRRSARTGQLVVREMLPLKPTQLIVLVDPWPSAATPPGPRSPGGDAQAAAHAELVISAAATAVCDALERGYRVGLVCRSSRPVVLPPSVGRAQRQRILQELTAAVEGATEPLDAIVAQIRWAAGWHARCLLCSTRLEPAHERVVRFLNTRAEAVAILSPQKEDFQALFEPAIEPAGVAL